jgi:hypothetical protein
MVPERRRCLPAVVAVSLLGWSPGAAQPVAPYIATTTPIQVGPRNHLCIAIDPLDPSGVWWWNSGVLGCATRSSDIIRASEATVSRLRDGLIRIEFSLAVHSIDADSAVPVRLVLDGRRLRSAETASQVDVEGRQDLAIPEEVPRGRR